MINRIYYQTKRQIRLIRLIRCLDIKTKLQIRLISLISLIRCYQS